MASSFFLRYGFWGLAPSSNVHDPFKMTSWPLKVKAMARLIACLLSKTDYFS
jgi:hypothetical protein